MGYNQGFGHVKQEGGRDGGGDHHKFLGMMNEVGFHTTLHSLEHCHVLVPTDLAVSILGPLFCTHMQVTIGHFIYQMI